jgi:hypothetical protein
VFGRRGVEEYPSSRERRCGDGIGSDEVFGLGFLGEADPDGVTAGGDLHRGRQ